MKKKIVLSLILCGYASQSIAFDDTVYDPNFYLNEFYYAFNEQKVFSVNWQGKADSLGVGACIDPDGFSSSKPYRVTMKKAHIARGSSISGLADNMGADIHLENLKFDIPDSAAWQQSQQAAGDYLPMVVGEDYKVKVEYVLFTPGPGCSGISGSVKVLGETQFTYDVHEDVMTFPVYETTHTRRIYHTDSNQCLIPNLDNATAFKTMIESTHCNTGDEKLAFEIVDAGTNNPNEVQLKSKILNQCLQPEYSNKNGSEVRAGACVDDLKTTFIIDIIKKGWDQGNVPAQFRLKHKNGGKCLYVHEATGKAHLWTCWTSPSPVKIFEFRKYL